METFCYDWMNSGKAFDLSAARLSLDAYRSATAAKSHALIERTKGLTNDTVQEVKAEVIAEARQAAAQEQMNVLVFDALCQVDPNVKALGIREVVKRLGIDGFLAVSKAVAKGIKVRPGTTGDADAPNGEPKPN